MSERSSLPRLLLGSRPLSEKITSGEHWHFCIIDIKINLKCQNSIVCVLHFEFLITGKSFFTRSICIIILGIMYCDFHLNFEFGNWYNFLKEMAYSTLKKNALTSIFEEILNMRTPSKSDLWDFGPMRHLIRVMRKDDLINKKQWQRQWQWQIQRAIFVT